MRVKTIATLGPKSESPETIEALIDAGLDIFRFNFSHASIEEAYTRSQVIHSLRDKQDRKIAIMQDLCGRRIRVGDIPNGSRELHDNEEVTFYTLGAPEPQENEIAIRDEYLHNDVEPGKDLLIEGGKFRATITRVEPDRHRIHTIIEKGGTLLSRKGINVPYVRLTSPAVTDKDKSDLEQCKDLHFEYIAMSFVQSAADLEELRPYLQPGQKVIAKVEDPIGVANIDEIIRAYDAIMIARGDLGVELPLEEIPFIQKEIIAKCRYAGKPSIVATQMLLSMVERSRPTRAEVSDVANAVIEGTDAVMLSDETAAGQYPVEALKTLVTIANRAEKFLYEQPNNFDQ